MFGNKLPVALGFLTTLHPCIPRAVALQNKSKDNGVKSLVSTLRRVENLKIQGSTLKWVHVRIHTFALFVGQIIHTYSQRKGRNIRV